MTLKPDLEVLFTHTLKVGSLLQFKGIGNFCWVQKSHARKICKTSMGQLCSILVTTLLLWEARGACNCYYTCTHVACFMCTSTKNEWNTQNIILSLSCTFGPPITHNLIMHVLTKYHLKLIQGTTLEQKTFDLQYCCLTHTL